MNKNTAKKKSTKPIPPKSVTETNSKVSPVNSSKKTLKFINWASLLLFIATAIYYMPILNKEFLIKADSMSLFLSGKYFFLQQLSRPGGLLAWLGTFFTQFFLYPWLGSTIYILFVISAIFLAIRAFRIPAKYYAVTIFLGLALILVVTQPGYLILTLKKQGFFFRTVLGFLITLLAIAGYRILQNNYLRAVAALLFILAGYPLFGFYAVLAVIITGIIDLIEYTRNKQKSALLPAIVSLVSAFAVPFLMYLYFYANTELTHIYLYGLPGFMFSKEELVYWHPYIGITLSLLFFAVYFSLNTKNESSAISNTMMIIVCLVAFAGFHKYCFKDENFRTEIAMSNAIEDNRWEDVLKLAKSHKDEPTRMIVMQTNLALQKLGRAGDEMFLYPNGTKEMKSPWPARLIVLFGRQMYYQYGQTNYCYHWSMEDMVERGMRVDYLKYMTKCAIIKGEMNLAKKYIGALKQTLFHKKWAEEYEKYIQNPQSMLNNSEFNSLRPLTAFNNELKGNSDVLELDLLRTFANSECPNLEMLDLSLQSTLMLRDNALFWPRFSLYVQTQSRIPRYYQEAALLFAHFQKNINISSLKFDQNIVDNFGLFMQQTQKNISKDNETNKQLFVGFKDTYWYYYFFVKDIKMH